ncbi:MAG: chemotaxis protein CheA [Granulosicoccus sp.]|nr:chemotaxis protein CheA [Granulosicoccus sp.]
MVDILQEFLTESREGLDQLDIDFVNLENDPSDTKTLASVFRIIHTVKGTSGFLGFATLEQVTHVGENLLDKLRNKDFQLNEHLTSLLLELVDVVREQLDLIAATGSDGGDYGSLISRLEAQVQGGNEESSAGGSIHLGDEQGNESVSQMCADVLESDDDEEVEPPVVAELDDEMKEVLRDFLQESFENLDRVDSELIELEEQPGNRDLLSSIFRSMHTIKGTCGFFGFEKLEKVTHIGENLLVKLRDGEHSMNEQIATALLAMVDAVRAMLYEISEKGHDGTKRYSKLIALLGELKDNGQLASDSKPSAMTAAESDASQSIAPDTNEKNQGDAASAKQSAAPNAEKPAATVDASAAQAEKPTTTVVEASIRVDVPVLDSLMNLVGELVLARNQIVEYVGAHENTQVVAAAQRLNLITSELQEGVMQTRMQPIHSVWAKLPRVVRDLSRACGKQIRVEMEGKSTELDKSLIEAMKDPITHLVRNSVDHGIEGPEDRIAAGKPAEGVLLLRAFHEGGQVHIEIADDGAGIKPEKIKKKAIENGVVTTEQAARMSDQELCKMIFLPGLSTAEQVTNISGRGVGMDVVKTNIEKISGAIDLDTEVGRGTVFKIRVPLTLAIVPALIVSTGLQRFAIPQVNLIELIRIDEEEQESAIEYIHGCPVHRLRGQLLPLVYLHKELMLDNSEPGAVNIVVLQAERCRFGLVVDQINDTQEIVVKPLAEALKSIPVFAGATIMGDGRVALILDTQGIGLRAGVMGDNPEKAVDSKLPETNEKTGESETLLLVRTGSEGRLAIPLSLVARLEQFEVSQTEMAGDTQVVQYRGQILPLVPLSGFLHERRAGYGSDEADNDLLQVVVFGEEGRQVGLVVDEIIDVVDEVLEVRGKASRAGVLGTAAVQGQVTELLDVTSFVDSTANLLIDLGEAA